MILSGNTLEELLKVKPKNVDINSLSFKIDYLRECDCAGGCTDTCADCAITAENPW